MARRAPGFLHGLGYSWCIPLTSTSRSKTTCHMFLPPLPDLMTKTNEPHHLSYHKWKLWCITTLYDDHISVTITCNINILKSNNAPRKRSHLVCIPSDCFSFINISFLSSTIALFPDSFLMLTINKNGVRQEPGYLNNLSNITSKAHCWVHTRWSMLNTCRTETLISFSELVKHWQVMHFFLAPFPVHSWFFLHSCMWVAWEHGYILPALALADNNCLYPQLAYMVMLYSCL